MKVKDLLKQLAAVHPETEIVISGSDHEYNRIRHAESCLAELTDDNCLSEWYDDCSPFHGGKRVVVIVLSR